MNQIDGPAVVNLDGLEVRVFRDTDDHRLTVCVYSDDVEESDTVNEHLVPRLRLVINCDSKILNNDGEWAEDVPSPSALHDLAEQAE